MANDDRFPSMYKFVFYLLCIIFNNIISLHNHVTLVIHFCRHVKEKKNINKYLKGVLTSFLAGITRPENQYTVHGFHQK